MTLDYAPATPKTGFYYGWICVLLASLAMVATLPARSFGQGLFTEPLIHDLDIGRITFTVINAIATLIGATFSLLAGKMVDRFGSRLMATLVGLALGLSVLLTGSAAGPLSLAIGMTLSRGFGQSALSNVSISIVGKWFVRRINIAMALYSFLLSIGFVIAFGIVGHIIEIKGWRIAWREMGGVLCLVLAPLMWLGVRDRPESVRVPVDGLPEPVITLAVPEEGGFTLPQAMQTPAFWLFILASFIYGLVYTGLTLLYENVFREHAIDLTQAKYVMGVMLLAGLVSNFVGGFLAQKWSLTRIASMAMLLLAASMFMLPRIRGASQGMAFAALFGFASGVVMVLFFSCWNKAFGRAHVGQIQGAAQALTVVASALGPFLLELTYRRHHSYNFAFHFSAPVVAALGVLAWFTPMPPNSTPPFGDDTLRA